MKTFIIKKYFFFIVFLLILNACGIGQEKVVPNEAAVLSGPPLTIPPDFDVQEPPNNDLGAPSPADILVQEDNENFANIPTLEQEAPYLLQDSQETINTFDSNNIQDFETFDPNKVQAFIPQQIENSKAKLSRQPRRVLVPSDVYDVDMSRLNNINQQKKASINYFRSGNNIVRNRIGVQNNQNLSKEEESLLKEIIIEDFETSDDIKDFETRGDSD